jgi:protein-tyrosine phosphatase
VRSSAPFGCPPVISRRLYMARRHCVNPHEADLRQEPSSTGCYDIGAGRVVVVTSGSGEVASSRHSGEFSVLFVCTANLCRSPLAEHLTRSMSAELGLDLRVQSAGTDAIAGKPIHPSVAATLGRRGLAVAPTWSSRRLDRSAIQAADLILVAEASHRSRVAQLDPSAVARTFLLLQFAELVQAARSDSVHSLADLCTAANAARSRIAPVRRRSAEILDPIGGRQAAFEACAATIQAAVEASLRPLATEDRKLAAD